MKPVCCIMLFSLLWFCSGCGTEANKPSPAEIKRAEQSRLQQELQHLIHRAEQKNNYAFRLQIQNPKQKEEYKGKQNGENCVILDAQGNKVMERKKDKVWAFHSGKKEEMTQEQAGLVSLKDHLRFIGQVYGEIEKNPDAKWMKVSVDSAKLTRNFKQRVNAESEQVLFPVYEEMEIYYELIYTEPQMDLKQMVLHVHDKNQAKQTLIYEIEE
ncbi:hypothetical protein [Thermoactinomyces sp. CICC 10735]|uniref:hypothetical protein n=1 Tax=Thermoactinomyces sp. CICC 10735 TaxID=2767430 RepID=UPI0018DBA336|nr:hypothetical protein [Thermoactinomyces sp. CICC 10735]MBH8582376.1 hypothetical protein [Thermoactinomyces sp. CICC 10735]